jgi:glutathionylspermidine synthase
MNAILEPRRIASSKGEEPKDRPALPRVRAAQPVDERVFASIRRRAVLEGCKWDPQVGDVSSLAPFPLILDRTTWNELATLAEQLAAETLSAEQEILLRPGLLNELGLPRAVRRVLKQRIAPTPAAVRVMRFDFHPAKEGWSISEVNSDVPGGFTEASFFTGLMAEHFSDADPAGNPVDRWADAIARASVSGSTVGLLTAPGFMEDHQIMAYLAGHLRERGLETHLANPTQLAWRDGFAHLETAWFHGRLDTIIRFYQGEWLASLPRRCGWEHFIRGGRTPVGNPGLAMISESKRFPLVWDRLAASLSTWRRLLPASRDPREAPWETDDRWFVKSAMSNTGDAVCIRELMVKRDWRRVRWNVWLCPNQWVAQRRFDSVPVDTPIGPMHACVGVYTIDGRAAGAYARLAKRPMIDYASVDAAVLVQENNDEGRDI